MIGFDLQWPLVVIDFEATALSTDSYPIEVGIAMAASSDASIETWSTLIKPDPSWAIEEQWDPDAERIHKISRWSLRDGMASPDVMRELNGRVAQGVQVWCDGGYYDEAWLHTLARASGLAPTFELHDLSETLQRNPDARQCYIAALAVSGPTPHRAGQDAQRILGSLRALLLA